MRRKWPQGFNFLFTEIGVFGVFQQILSLKTWHYKEASRFSKQNSIIFPEKMSRKNE